jgi:tRNA (guanine9-N1)-methyltransferase
MADNGDDALLRDEASDAKKYTKNPPPEGMSKREWKRIQKRQRWEDSREDYLLQKREKRKQARENKKKRVLEGGKERSPKKQRINPDQQVQTDVGIVIDCAFDDLMKDGEVMSLSQQIVRCYSENRRAAKQVKMSVTSFNKRLRQRFEGPLQSHYRQWRDADFTPDSYSVKDASQAVYLSADSENVIEKLEPGKVYIIGGIVDKNRHKNLCNNKAREQGIQTGRLPIDQYIQISGRKVLTVNHVFEILLRWLETENWKTAFEAVLPTRKLEHSTQQTPASNSEGEINKQDGESI